MVVPISPLQSAVGEIVVLQDSLVALGKAVWVHLFAAAELAVIEPHNEQVPAAILISPHLGLLHLHDVRKPQREIKPEVWIDTDSPTQL